LPGMVPPAVNHLLNHPEQLEFMRQQAVKMGQPKAALNIAEMILEKLQSQQAS
jgi:UDP-N-acetylglucosamine:LPS N-acetylglucosamine transferase